MAHRSRFRHAWSRLWHRHGLQIAVWLIVLVVLVGVGLLTWLMSDVRFR